MPPSSQKYKCLCSTCHGVSRLITKRTIEAHLKQDQDLFKSISGDSDFAISVRSHIIATSSLLAQLHGGRALGRSQFRFDRDQLPLGVAQGPGQLVPLGGQRDALGVRREPSDRPDR